MRRCTRVRQFRSRQRCRRTSLRVYYQTRPQRLRNGVADAVARVTHGRVGAAGIGGQKAAGGERMRINRREAAGRGLTALLMSGLLLGGLSGCATPPRTVSHEQNPHVTRVQGPPVPHPAVAKALRTDPSALSARLIPVLKKTSDVLLDLILPIPSGRVPSWASQVNSDCFAQVLSQWCTQFHLQ